MKKYALFLIIGTTLASSLLVGCGHTNDLANYPIRGATASYRARTANDALSSHAYIQGSHHDPILSIAAAIGSDAAATSAARRIANATNPDSLVDAFSVGMEQACIDYLQLKDDPDSGQFIVESTLEEFEINSSTSGISAKVKGTSRIIQRSTGKIVWENTESRTVPLRSSGVAGVFAITGAINAVELANLPESEIRAVLSGAAADAGRQMGEVLREDASNLR